MSTKSIMDGCESVTSEDFESPKNQFKMLFISQSDTDITFKLSDGNGERSIGAHKVILKTRSKYFAKLIEQQWNGEHNVIEIDKKTNYNVFYEILFFIYVDEVRNFGDKDFTLQLLDKANEYCIQRLKLKCLEKLAADDLDINSSIELLHVANLYNSAHLEKNVLAFIKRHLDAVMAHPDWKDLDAELVSKVLACFSTSKRPKLA